MPDDRPVSPEERLREALTSAAATMKAAAVELADAVNDRGLLAGLDAVRDLAADAALALTAEVGKADAVLSTPAGPSPEDEWTYTTETPKSADLFDTAPSPREEAVEAGPLDLDAVEAAAREIHRHFPRTGAVEQVHYNAARAALSAARPSSPTPEETP